MELYTERCADKISGGLSCLDRVVITGTIPSICCATSLIMIHFLTKIG